jgi:hypothetical protein
MTEHRCAGRVFTPGSFRDSACSRKGKHFQKERWWCGTHLPSKEEERRAERNRIGDLKSAVMRAGWDREKIAGDLIKAAIAATKQRGSWTRVEELSAELVAAEEKIAAAQRKLEEER